MKGLRAADVSAPKGCAQPPYAAPDENEFQFDIDLSLTADVNRFRL